MTDEQVAFIVLQRVKWDTIAMPGSRVVRTNCGHAGFAAPTGQAFLTTTEGAAAYIVCTDCWPDWMLHDKEETEVRSVPGARVELESKLSQAEIDKLARLLKVTWQ